MRELDLHGYFHHQVQLEVENFVFLNSKELPVRIIVGRSEMMRNLVEDVLKLNKFTYNIPAHNPGEIIVLS
jgi:hypothetical protein